MEKTKRERLEDALLEFVERVSKQPSAENEVDILPQMAAILSELLRL